MRKLPLLPVTFAVLSAVTVMSEAIDLPLLDRPQPVDAYTGHMAVINETTLPPVDIASLATYVVNLDRSPERLQKVDRQLKIHGLDYVRHQAVDGLDLSLTDNAGNDFTGEMLRTSKRSFVQDADYTVLCPSGKINYRASDYLRPGIGYRRLTAGELGCYCSHIGVWKSIVDNAPLASLILEDDVVLDFFFKKHAKNVLNNLPEKWDVIFDYVESLDPDQPGRYRNDLFSLSNNSVILKYKLAGGTIGSAAAYFLSTEGAKKLLALSKNIALPVDFVMSEAIRRGEINAYRTFERHIVAETGPSYIEEMGRH